MQVFPEGSEFFEFVEETEKACGSTTQRDWPTLGHKAGECRERLGDLLSLLYREACCYYGCIGGDHVAERIAGRVVSHALAAYRLLSAGYYDEALALTRNLGETANLLWLFIHQPALLDIWKQADDRSRRRDFAPVKVRLALEALKVPVPIPNDHYAGLCEVAVHTGPSTSPQVHNPMGVPTLGSIFQEGGAVVSLNELAGAVGVCAAGLLDRLTPGDRRARLKAASVSLLRAVGGVDLASLRDAFRGA
jgi:hypothetical protein